MCDRVKPIGGFLGWESSHQPGHPYHRAVELSTGRSCFLLILLYSRPTRVYLPYYVCDSLLAPLLDLGIRFSFYALDSSLAIKQPPGLKPRELILYINYFGLKNAHVRVLQRTYGDQLVIDDAQAFFRRGHPGCWSFNSARKFFGVPDGAYLYALDGFRLPNLPQATPPHDHLLQRVGGSLPVAYRRFQEYESSLDHQARVMSAHSRYVLRNLDYEAIAASRRENFRLLHEALGSLNGLEWTLDVNQVPLYYPFLFQKSLRAMLIERGIFVPQFWPEVESRLRSGFGWEKQLATTLLPLPLDQRYGAGEMAWIIDEVSGLLQQ